MILVPYQQRWVSDPSQFKVVTKSRRIGFSWATALDIAISAASGQREYIASASHSQANDLLAEVILHTRVMERMGGQPIFKGTPAITQFKTLKGGLVRSMSTRAASMRGPGGNLTLDEFAWMPRSREVWAAASAITDPTLGRPQGYKLRVISTPAGDDEDNQFWRLWHKPEGDKFSKHSVTIYDACKDGFPIDPEQKRRDVADSELFEQEYNCCFLSASARYIPAALLDRCLLEHDSDIPTGQHQVLYAGMDVARKRDNSAIEQGTKIGDTLYNFAGEARAGVPWDEQEQWAGEILEQKNFGRLAVDETGLGHQFAERLVNAYGPHRVEPVNFASHHAKEAVITGLKLAMDRAKLRIRNDPDLRRDILNLRRTMTTAGNVRYDAPRTTRGHSDRAIALALMVHAAGGMAADRSPFPQLEVGTRPRRTTGWY